MFYGRIKDLHLRRTLNIKFGVRCVIAVVSGFIQYYVGGIIQPGSTSISQAVALPPSTPPDISLSPRMGKEYDDGNDGDGSTRTDFDLQSEQA